MVKTQATGKQTSFRFSATSVGELEWLVRKLGQTQTTVVETAIHRLAEAEGYGKDPEELIACVLAHEAGHAILAHTLMERGIQIGSDVKIELRRMGGTGDPKIEIAGENSVEIRRVRLGEEVADLGSRKAPDPRKAAKSKRSPR